MRELDPNFDNMCKAFTLACIDASIWKHNYSGAAYATRVKEAISHLKMAIEEVEKSPEIGFVNPYNK